MRTEMRCLTAVLALAFIAVLPPGLIRGQEPSAQPEEDQPASESTQEAASEPLSFSKQIAPILVKNCLACHGMQDPKSDYQLGSYEVLMKAGATESPSVTPKEPENSQLYTLVAEADEDLRMPQEADALPAEEIELIRRWIAEGAQYDGTDPKATLASIIPRPTHPDPPSAYRVPIPATAVALSPDGAEVAVSGYREVTIWSATNGTLIRRLTNVAERTYGLAYRPDGSLLAVASGIPGQLGEVKLFDPRDGRLVAELGNTSDVMYGVAFSPDGTRLAACSADRSIRVYDVASAQQQLLIEDHADWVMSVEFSNDGTRLASASRDKTSKLFDAMTGDALITYSGHGQTVFGVAFNVDGTQLYTSGADNKIHVWNAADGAKTAEIGGFGNEVYRVLVRAGTIFSCSADKSARQHDVEKREEKRVYSGHADWIYSLDYNEASQRLATGSYDGEVRIWNVADGALITSFKAAPGFTVAVAQPAGN